MRIPPPCRTLALTLLLLAGSLASDVMAIAVAPTAVYLSDGRPAEAITLYNPSTTPEEVTVEAVFGYPTTDAEGRVRLSIDASGQDPRSAVSWIQVLPRRLVVPPEERRVVRLLARAPVGTPDGEYWARLVFTSRGQKVPVAGVPDSSGVRVGLDLEVRTIIAVSYRKGTVRTGVRVDGFQPRIEGDSLFVRPNLIRQGDGAYIGRLDFALQDHSGANVRSWSEQVAVYREYHRRYAYAVDDVPAGSYSLVMRLSTERDDVPEADRLPSLPVELSGEVAKP